MINRVTHFAVGCVLALCGLAFAPHAALHPACALADSSNHAALVIEHGNGQVLTQCVSFPGTQASAEDILRASGIEFQTVTYGFGDEICQIDNEPQQFPPSCIPPGAPYWAFFTAQGNGDWQYADHGASSTMVSDGDAVGFRYDSQSNPLAPPSPQGVCDNSSPTPSPPTPTPTPTSSPTPPPGGGQGNGSSPTPTPSGALQLKVGSPSLTPTPSPSPSPRSSPTPTTPGAVAGASSTPMPSDQGMGGSVLVGGNGIAAAHISPISITPTFLAAGGLFGFLLGNLIRQLRRRSVLPPRLKA